MVSTLPHVNAGLNLLATVLLVAGYVLIKQRRETAHKWTMLASFGVSTAFLVCYVIYHISIGGSRHFPSDAGFIRWIYLTILVTHIVLAMAVPFLAIGTIYLGLKDLRQKHVKWARWTFPIWLYVSITGVIVYVMLYHLYK
jgi:putative membrane protein